MKELDQSKRIMAVLMKWPHTWVNTTLWSSGRLDEQIDIIDSETLRRYRKLIEYYSRNIIIQNDEKVIIKVPEINDGDVMTFQNRWIKSNSTYADILIVSLDSDTHEFDRAILCYCAKPFSKKTLSEDDYVTDVDGRRCLNLEFRCKFIEGEGVDDLAKEYVETLKRFEENLNRSISEKWFDNLKKENDTNNHAKSYKVKPTKRKKVV